MREVVRDKDGGKARLIANPIRMSRTPPRYDRLPPALGEHTDDIERNGFGQ